MGKIITFVFCFLGSAITLAQSLGDMEWKPKFIWQGDIRYRLAKVQEDIDQERNFQQLRARLGLLADVNEDVSIKLRLATGTSAVSSNQTLGDSKDPGMPRRSFGLDLAYIDWKWGALGTLWVGRTPVPFWSPAKDQLIFDSDLSFEGIAYKFESKWSSSKLFINLGSSMISENYDSTARQDVVDTGIVGAQIGYSEKWEWFEITLHSAHVEYVNIQDKNITSIDASAKTDVYSTPYDVFKGNTVYRPDPLATNYFYKNKYILETRGIEVKVSYSDMELIGYFDYVENRDIAIQNIATETGAIFKWGRSQFMYADLIKELDSVVGAFTDSDANGGGTDNKGQKISYSYQLSNNSQVAFTKFEAKRGVKTAAREFESSQLDFLISF